jgi:recombination protein RecA
MSGKSEQKNAVRLSLARLEKKFGAGVAVQMGSKKIEPVEVFRSGCIALDLAIGDAGVNCGIPWGRIIELFGSEAGGKTTLALTILAQVQKQKKLAAYIDAEHALDPVYAARLGVDMKNLVVSQPDYGEQGLEVAEELITSGAVSIVAVDSVAALTPKAELEGNFGDGHPGLMPRMMGQALRKLAGEVRKHRVCMIFINQLREKVGVIWGNPEVTPGGRALKFWASLRLDVRKSANLKDGERIVGARTRIKVVKNKIAKPFKEGEFDLIFGDGISREGELLDFGAKYGIVQRDGGWYAYNGERIGQGREAAKNFLRQVPETCAAIEAAIYERAAQEASNV